MQRKRMRWWAPALTALTLVVIAGCGGGAAPGGQSTPAKQEAKGTAKIAIIAPVTGNFALLGSATQRGAELAIADINAKGGAGGYKIEGTVYDTGQTNDTAIAAFQKALADKPVAAVGMPISTQGFAIADMLKKEKMPFLVSGTNTKLAGTADGWMYTAIAHDGINALAGTQFAVKELGKKKIAILRGTDEYGQGAADIIKATAKQLGAEVVADESLTLGDKDVSAQLTRIKNSPAEIVMVWSAQAEMAIAVKQAQLVGLKIPLISAILIPATVNLLTPQEAKGVYSVVMALPFQSKDPKVMDFAKRFEEKYKASADAYSATAYDAVQMAAAGIAKSGTSREGVKQYLDGLKDFDGVFGKHFNDGKGALTHQSAIAQLTEEKKYQLVQDIAVK